MRLVNHASELIHQVYQRERVEDVAQRRDAVTFSGVIFAVLSRDALEVFGAKMDQVLPWPAALASLAR